MSTAAMPTLVHRVQQVPEMQHADDVLRLVAVHGVARVRRVEHRLQALLRRKLDRERDHLGPRPHHVVRLLVGEVEDLVEHLLLLLLELALDGRALEQHLQLGLGVDGALAARRLHPEQAEGRVARFLQEPDQRPEEPDEAAHGGSHPQRELLGALQRQPLRHELAGDDVEEREDEQRQDHRDHRRRDRVEDLQERVLAQSTDCQRGDGDAELHRGDERRRLVRDLRARASRAGCPPGGAPPSASGAR